MSKPLTRRAASFAFAQGADNIRTGANLTFVGDVAYSYAEPIAVRIMRRNGPVLYATTAKFSMTTSHHRGAVAGCFAVENGSKQVHDVDHRLIRDMARARGLPVGPAGRRFDPIPSSGLVPDGHGFFRKATDAEIKADKHQRMKLGIR